MKQQELNVRHSGTNCVPRLVLGLLLAVVAAVFLLAILLWLRQLAHEDQLSADFTNAPTFHRQR